MSYGSIKYPFIFLELEFPLILNSSAICAMFILLIELDVAEFLVYVDSYCHILFYQQTKKIQKKLPAAGHFTLLE